MITRTSTKKCDARCWNAKSKTCSCSCGGKHHGSQPTLQLGFEEKPVIEGEVILQVQIEHDEYFEILQENRIAIHN